VCVCVARVSGGGGGGACVGRLEGVWCSEWKWGCWMSGWGVWEWKVEGGVELRLRGGGGALAVAATGRRPVGAVVVCEV
jgi:hypothetical protein